VTLLYFGQKDAGNKHKFHPFYPSFKMNLKNSIKTQPKISKNNFWKCRFQKKLTLLKVFLEISHLESGKS